MLLFTHAIRKSASSMLSAASQLFLLIKWRSLRTLLSSDFRASTESELRRVQVNCNKKISGFQHTAFYPFRQALTFVPLESLCAGFN